MTSSNTVWNVPKPLSTVDVPVDDDTFITLRRHGNPDGPRLVLSHGNGLAIDISTTPSRRFWPTSSTS